MKTQRGSRSIFLDSLISEFDWGEGGGASCYISYILLDLKQCSQPRVRRCPSGVPRGIVEQIHKHLKSREKFQILLKILLIILSAKWKYWSNYRALTTAPYVYDL